MLRSYRSLLVALGLVGAPVIILAWWLISSATNSQAVIEQEAAEKTAAYAENASAHVQRYCARLAPADQYSCVREAIEATNKAAHDERDLEAQLVTSVWTHYMGLAAIGGTAFGIIGIFLVFATFRAASHANAIARESMEGQLRPWVTFSVSKTGTFSVVDDNLELSIGVTFENIGQSPAIDLTYMGTMIFGDDINPHFRGLVEAFRVGDHDWADKNLFPGVTWDRKVGAVHTGARHMKTLVTIVIIARYRTPFSGDYRFTARAFEVQVRRQTDAGGYEMGSFAHDLSVYDKGRGSVGIAEKQHFSGYAT